jgi:hypothetical protein
MMLTQPDGNATAITVTPTWQLFSTSGAAAAGSVNYGLRLRGGQTPANSNTADVLIWGARLHYGASALTYVPTTTAAVYSLPRDYNPTTLAALGVLVEEARTNLLLRSEEFLATAWAVPAGSALALGNTTAPNGTPSAGKLTRAATSGVALGYGAGGLGLTVTAVLHTVSFYAKADTQSSFTLAFVTLGKALGSEVVFNLTAVTAGTVTNYGATTGSVASIVDVGNGWRRCTLSVTATAATWFIQAEMPSAGAYWLWGAQLEVGAFATSYIPTVASQVTRAADQISILTSAFPYSATEGTVFVDGSINGNGTGNTGWWALDAGGTQNGHALRVAVGGNIVAISRGLTTNQTVVGLASAVAGTFYGTAFAYSNENDRAISTEGAAAVAGSTAVGTINSATTLRFGFQQVTTTGGYLNGHIKRLAYYASRKTDAELVVLSS